MLPNLAYPVLPSRGQRALWPYSVAKSALFGPGRYLSWTPSVAAVNETKGTFALWVRVLKHGPSVGQEIRIWDGRNDASNRAGIKFTTTGGIQIFRISGGATTVTLDTASVYRDITGWYHIVVQFDTIQATETDRVKLWVNGRQVALTGTWPGYNLSMHMMGQGKLQEISNSAITGCAYRLADYHYIDGQVVSPYEFGGFIGDTWYPKEYVGSYPGNSLHMDFRDGAQPGKDVSGNSNHWTAPGDMALAQDSPTNTFPVLNNMMGTAGIIFEWGNVRITNTVGGVGWRGAIATMAYPETGRWYYEVRGDNGNEDLHVLAGGTRDWPNLDTYFSINPSFACQGNGNISGQFITAWGNDSTKVLGVLYDADAGQASFYLNGVQSGPTVSYAANGRQIYPAFGVSWSTTNGTGAKMSVNFGHSGFTYPPPAGAKALCAANLPYPALPAGAHGLQTRHYTGNAVDGRQLSVPGFDPSRGAIVWGKQTGGTQNWFLFDTVRGATKYLCTNDITSAEITSAGGVQAFMPSTIKIGISDYINGQVLTYAAHTFRVGARSGIDVVAYTGTGSTLTLPHSLGAAPEVIFMANRTTSGCNRLFGHANIDDSAPWNYGLSLNLDAARVLSTGYFSNTAPTATQFTLGSSTGGNKSGDSHIAYLFRSIPGFSKCGYYIGNGSTDGPTIYLGFRPALVLIKNVSTAATSWHLYDNWRNGKNDLNYPIYPDLSNASGATCGIEFLAMGFKLITTGASQNNASDRHIYLAFAEMPGKFANAR